MLFRVPDFCRVLPYTNLRAANVLSTLSAITLCAKGKAKRMLFVSSTATLDHEYYIEKSDRGVPVSEGDPLGRSRQGLGTGYGQSKWASEWLMWNAGQLGLIGAIVCFPFPSS